MSKAKYKLLNDSPVASLFCLAGLVIFLLDCFLLKGKLSSGLLCSPTVKEGALPFAAGEGKSLARLFLYVFGYSDKILVFLNLMIITLCGCKMEEYYGSAIIGIMMIVSIVFTGVLSACFCKVSLCGCDSVIFMLIFLDIFISLSKKKISISSILVTVLFLAKEFITAGPQGIIGVFIFMAGGLCGSLFALLASPKARRTRKSEKQDVTEDFSEKKGFSFSSKSTKAKKNTSSDETVIGSIEI